ncbi:MAG: lysophospholipase L1-like esterase [Planctomycetota bacterium]
MVRRLLALLASVSLGLIVFEVGFRYVGPRSFERPQLRDEDGNKVDLSEVLLFFRDGTSSIPEEPRGGMKPDFQASFCYDRPQWDYFDSDGCCEVSINSLGFRDEEFPIQKPAGELRVLAIGDSFTFAQGCRAEDGWTEVLEEMLREETGGPVQVMNAGFTGGGSWPQEYAPWVLAHALSFEPDLVIYGMCLNDIDRRVPMLAYASIWDRPKLWGKPWLGGISEALTYFQRGQQQRVFEKEPVDLSLLLQADPSNWNANQVALRSIHEYLESAEIPFTLAIFPMLSMLGDKYPYKGLHSAVAEFCETEQIDYLDLYAPFHTLEDRELWVHPFDQHPNPVGHRIFAEEIYAHIAGR